MNIFVPSEDLNPFLELVFCNDDNDDSSSAPPPPLKTTPCRTRVQICLELNFDFWCSPSLSKLLVKPGILLGARGAVGNLYDNQSGLWYHHFPIIIFMIMVFSLMISGIKSKSQAFYYFSPISPLFHLNLSICMIASKAFWKSLPYFLCLFYYYIPFIITDLFSLISPSFFP